MYDDDRDALAAEYVLGTLSADERDQAEALLVIDPGFAEIVRVWERRLGELNVMVEAVEPPPDVWDRIKTEVDGAEQHIAAEIEAARPANEQNAPATEASLLPTIEEATPQIAPETPAEVMPEVAGEPAEPTLDFSSTPAEDSAATPPEDPDDSAAVAALASSLLPPDENTEAQKPPSLQPTPAPAGPKIERSAEVVYLAGEARRWRGVYGGDECDRRFACGLYRGRPVRAGPSSNGPAAAIGGDGAARLPACRGIAAGADGAGISAHGRSAKPHHDGAQGDRKRRPRPQLRTLVDPE